MSYSAERKACINTEVDMCLSVAKLKYEQLGAISDAWD